MTFKAKLYRESANKTSRHLHDGIAIQSKEDEPTDPYMKDALVVEALKSLGGQGTTDEVAVKCKCDHQIIYRKLQDLQARQQIRFDQSKWSLDTEWARDRGHYHD